MLKDNTTNETLLLPQFTLGSIQKYAEQHGIRIGHGGSPAKLNEYDLFITHCATPEDERPVDEITDKEFQQKYNVSSQTIWRWTRRKGFAAEVEKRQKSWAQSKVPNVLKALYIGAIKKKTAKEIALFLEFSTGFKSRLLNAPDMARNEEFTMDDVRRMLEFLPPDRRKYFNDTIIQIFNEAAEYARRASEDSEGVDGGELPGDSGELPQQADHADEAPGAAHPVA